MIERIADNSVVVMDLVDLEHCGFNVEDFVFEWTSRYIHPSDAPLDPAPVALLVNFTGGAVLTPKTSDETKAKMAQADARFQLLRRIIENGPDLLRACEYARATAEEAADGFIIGWEEVAEYLSTVIAKAKGEDDGNEKS